MLLFCIPAAKPAQQVLEQDGNMIPPDLPKCWYIFGTVGDEAALAWREAGMENKRSGNLAIWHSRSLRTDRNRMEVREDWAM